MSLVRLLLASAFVAACVSTAACTAPSDDGEDMGESQDEIRTAGSFVSRGTGYYPANNSLEGGFVDRKGAKLRTLQGFLSGGAAYVSVAMDSNAFKYGQRLRIRELEQKYGKPIIFRVVDTGGAFRGKGRSRIDICVANGKAAVDPTINGTLHIDIIDERSGPPEPSPNAPDPAEPTAGSDTPASGSSSSSGGTSGDTTTSSGPSGAKCASTGACNPGNDGSGLICVEGRCVPGCISNAQCPGSSTCQGGQCR